MVGFQVEFDAPFEAAVERVTAVGLIDPQTIAGLSPGPQVREVADDAAGRLRRVRERLQTEGAAS